MGGWVDVSCTAANIYRKQSYLNPFHDNAIDNDPSCNETEKHPPFDALEVIDAITDILQKMNERKIIFQRIKKVVKTIKGGDFFVVSCKWLGGRALV